MCPFLCRPHPCLFFSFPKAPWLSGGAGGAEREQFGTGLDFQSTIYNTLFISLPWRKGVVSGRILCQAQGETQLGCQRSGLRPVL